MIRFIKILIWLYLLLLVFEGALRKWVLPSLAEPLLVVRDPVVIGIYICALVAGVFPRNGFIAALGVFAALSALFSVVAGQSNLFVMLYGLRIDFLHVPLIWVMGRVLDRRDVERLALGVLALAILMSLLMVKQFRSPVDAWINRGVGTDDNLQMYGADGRIRPPGFFAFITGPMSFFPLAAACFFYFVTKPAAGRRLQWLFVLAGGAAIAMAMPVSISRGTMITTGLVGVAFVGCLFFSGLSAGGFLRFGAVTVILCLALWFLPVFHEARDAFMERWDTAAQQSAGDAWGSLTERVASGFTAPLATADRAPFFGYGIGVGSNVGARLLGGRMGFILGENEWMRTIQELGPLLGIAFIGFRCVLALVMFVHAWRALRRGRDTLPMLIWVAAAPLIVLQQWGPPTMLGFAVFGGGLLMASLNVSALPVPDFSEEVEVEEKDISELAQARRRMRGLA